jgi:alpha-galactosidase
LIIIISEEVSMNAKTMVGVSMFALATWFAINGWAAAISPSTDEMSVAKQWTERLEKVPQAADGTPFFSFTYDGKPSAELLAQWERNQSSRQLDAQRTERTTTWTDPKTGLEVRCVSVVYADFPVIEWTVYFKNAGTADTPILENVQGMDVSFKRKAEGGYILRSIRGDDCSPASYQPTVTNLEKGANHSIVPPGGRPTTAVFPYFNVEWSGQGVIAVLGWPGRWAAKFDCDQSSVLRIQGGQEVTKLKLHPGEEIRTPLSVLMFWKGDVVRSQNLWRRWMIAHNLPRAGGKLPPVFLSSMGPTGMALQPVAAAEIAAMDAYRNAGIKFDYWWIDAGWYPCNGTWQYTGTWEPDATRFPKGVKEVTDHAHAKGMKFVLWFEPERVGPNSWLTKNHPEWIFGGADGGLLNMGNPDAKKWVTEHFSRLIEEQGVDLYREDFNIDPLGYWQGNDAPDRQGITENLYIQGKLSYWDELRRKFPDNLIDSCASGGQRNDLETLRRAVPLLRSDYYSATQPGNPAAITGNQGHTYGLSMWVPYFGVGVLCNDLYDIRSHLTPELGMACKEVTDDPNQVNPLLRRAVDDWHAMAPEFYGDYYPLTKYSLSEEEWMAWQFNRPENGTGMVQAFRRTSSPYESIRVKLQGLDEDAVYALTNIDVPGTTEMTGRDLSEKGLSLTIKEPRGALIITYKKKT